MEYTRRKLALLLVILISLVALGCAMAQQMALLEYIAVQQKSDLFPYIKCKCGDDLKIVQIDRFPPSSPRNRPVMGENGEKAFVSVKDGYRVMYAFDGIKYLFANIKVESSLPGEYESDKSKVLIGAKYIANGKEKNNLEYVPNGEINGYHVAWFERTLMDEGSTFGTYSIFSDKDEVIVTVYLLNQGKMNRKFETLEEYKNARKEFLEKLTKCMSTNDRDLPISL